MAATGSPPNGMTTSITPSIPRYPVSGKATMRISARWPLAYTLRNGYFHAGTYSSFRRRRHGRALDTSAIPATRLLAYTCTHDQVGNRALGDRPSQYLTGGQLAIKAALTLGSPYTAMLFMGEEWGPPARFSSLLTSRTGTGP